MTKRRTRTAKLPFCKVCNLEDFENKDLLPLLEQVGPNRDYGIPESKHRKYWEMAMTIRVLEERGLVGGDARVLGVGAGMEGTSFYLTAQTGEVHVTDMYLEPGVWSNEAPQAMLTNPAQFSPKNIITDMQRLIVQHMDARDLRYPDASFDAVFCTSSIEHFGNREDVARSAREMARVLKPGGVMVLATEMCIGLVDGEFDDGNDYGWKDVLLFTSENLQRDIIAPSGLELMGKPDYGVSDATLETKKVLSQAIADNQVGREVGPHIVLIHKGMIFTSVFLALVKPELEG